RMNAAPTMQATIANIAADRSATQNRQLRLDRAYKKTQIIEINNPITIATVVQLISHASIVASRQERHVRRLN
ncbi:MAG: hypothetical protein J2P55_08155, partial [Rhizobiales bacterium]|nr:hypothetical protein [Hyphomicrobiales bacterium]